MIESNRTQTTPAASAPEPAWCVIHEDNGADVTHRDVPAVVIPREDPEHMVTIGLAQSDEWRPDGGLEVYAPEVAVAVRTEVAHLSLAEAAQLRSELDAALARATAGTLAPTR